eukprot:gnl/TRDRNA2_/TRDRNA2_176417_c3_seq1.p1 gnl/TRDRNA2_/TRDRNA2_176417_c3~~gnl/TRDRNA2_/TRDRNA2_176417_c3_seq1.p1  ORF type:complete len:395 (+),score=93.72 gnl/TRDRNA2_/TRDRNA2_176417_c3_seq1:52-1236(+)
MASLAEFQALEAAKAAKEAYAPNARFQYRCPFRKRWVDCLEEEDTVLKKAFLQANDENPSAEYAVNSVRMLSDFSRMKRTNLISKVSMDLKLEGGKLPRPQPKVNSELDPAQVKMSAKAKQTKEVQAPKPDSHIVGDDEESEEEEEEELNDAAKFMHQLHADMDVKKAAEGEATAKEDPKMPKPIYHAAGNSYWSYPYKGMDPWKGTFEFKLPLENKDSFAEIIKYEAMTKGVTPEDFDSRFLSLTDARGRVIEVSRNPPNNDKVEAMLDDSRSYPIKVKYKPPKNFHNMDPFQRAEFETNSFMMQWIRSTVEDEDSPTLAEVKHMHQRLGFERYQMYVQDDLDAYTRKNMSLEEYGARYPDRVPGLLMIMKTGPVLKQVFRGEEDILAYIFGS